MIRFSRKTKEQYVQSEVDGKPTGWRAFYDGGKVEGRRQALMDGAPACMGRAYTARRPGADLACAPHSFQF